MALPSTALLCGLGVSFIVTKRSFFSSRSVQYSLTVLVVVVCLLASIYQQRNFLFQMTPIEACRAVFHENPFPESLEVASFVKAHTQKKDRIAVIGSEPQIYFYSDRLSASSYIYMYPLVENHVFAIKMQKEMIHQLEAAQPKYLIFVNNHFSWLKQPHSKDLIFRWLAGYQAKYYEPVGLVDMLKAKTRYYWGAESKVSPRSEAWIAIFARKT